MADHRHVSGSEILRIVDVIATSGAHVRDVVPVLHRDYCAVHRHLREVGTLAVLCVEFGSAFQRIRLLPKFLALRGSIGRKRLARWRIEFALASHGAFAANIHSLKCIELAGVWYAGDHSILLLDVGIRRRRVHFAELQRRTGVLAQIRQQARSGDGGGREGEWRADADSALRDGNRVALGRHQPGANAVVRFDAREVRLHEPFAGDLAALDSVVDILDGRFFEVELAGGYGDRRGDGAEAD